MFARLYMTGKSFIIDRMLQHDIKCTVNDVSASFTVANDELCSFGLYDSTHSLIGYYGDRGLVQDHQKAVLVNGFWEPRAIDAPKGSYIAKVKTYFLSDKGVFSKRLAS